MSGVITDAQFARSLRVLRTIFANYGLTGMTVALFAIWASNARTDSLYTKLTVVGMFLANAMQTAGLTIGVWSNIVDNWDNRAALLEYHWGFKVSNLFQFVVGLLAQAFYLNRIFRLCRDWKIVGFGILLSVANLATGLCQYVYRLATPGYSSPQMNGQFALAYLWMTLFAEVYIASVFIYFINKERRGFNEDTDGIILRLVKIAVEASGITCIVAVASAIQYTAGGPEKNSWVAWYTQIAPTYLIGVLYSLNSRKTTRDQIESGRRNPNVSAYSLTASRTGARYLNKEPVNGVNHVSLNVRVDTEEIRETDIELQKTELKEGKEYA